MNDVYQLGDPEPIMRDGKMTDHGADVYRQNKLANFESFANGWLQEILHDVKSAGEGEKTRISKVAVSSYVSRDGLFGELGILPYVGYVVEIEVSTLNLDGSWSETEKFSLAG